MSKVVTFNGVDNVGKTTQLDLLAAGTDQSVHVVPKLASFDDGWKRVSGDFDWWFAPSDHDDWLELMFASILKRESYMHEQRENLVLADRGTAMFEVVIAATIATRMQLATVAQGRDVACEFCDKRNLKISKEADAEIVFTHGVDKGASIDLTMERAGFSDEGKTRVYRRYQSFLYEGLSDSQVTERYALVRVNRKSVRRVQREMRELLNGLLGVKTFRKMSTSVESVVGITGLSETGKGTFAQILRRHWNYLRLKLNFFTQQADVAIDDPSFFAQLVDCFEQFCQSHYFETRFSLESFHGRALIEQFAAYYGDSFLPINVTCPSATVHRRVANNFGIETNAAVAIVEKKNTGKALPNANDYQCRIVDIDNAGDEADLAGRVNTLMHERHGSNTRLTTVDELMIPQRYRDVVKAAVDKIIATFPVRLIALVGSGGREDISPEVSDIDLYVIVDGDPSVVKAAIKSSMRHIDGIKIGTCVYSTSDGATQVEDAGKLKYIHYKLSTGESPVIWVRSDRAVSRPRINTVELVEYINKSRTIHDYVALTETEIAVLPETEVLKHIHTIMKLLCLLRNIEVEGYQNVHTVFYRLFASENPPRVSTSRKVLVSDDGESIRTEMREFLSWAKAFLNNTR